MTCPTCHRPSRFVVLESVLVHRRRVEWAQCLRCWLVEEALHEVRVSKAIEQAERSGV